jgi:DNA-binding YbaB/EbfC family protein
MNQNQMMQQVRRMQAEMEKAQDELANTTVTASAGGGAVTVVMACNHEVKSIKLTAEAVDPSDVETLEDLLVVALNEATAKAQEAANRRMGAVTGGIKIPGIM